MMEQRSGYRIGLLEFFLVAAILSFVAILFPAITQAAFESLDVRQWSRGTWFIANLCLVAALVTVRFGPDLVRDWRERRRDSVRQREKGELANRAKERRESSERLDESRKRTTF